MEMPSALWAQLLTRRRACWQPPPPFLTWLVQLLKTWYASFTMGPATSVSATGAPSETGKGAEELGRKM